MWAESSIGIYIVGAGVQGLMTAYELALAGCAVTVIDDSSTTTQASWAGGGILSPLYPWRYTASITRLTVWSQQYYPEFITMLDRDTAISSDWIQSGLVIIDDHPQEALQWAEEFNVALEIIHERYIQAVEPLATEATSAVWIPGVAQIRSPRLLQALKAKLACLGVKIEVGIELLDFEVGDNQLTAIETSKGRITTGCCVIAAGAWTGRLLRKTDFTLPVEPVRGQMIAISTSRNSYLRRIVLKGGIYAIPRRDGLIVIGSTLERVGFNGETTAEAAQMLLGAAEQFLPALSGAAIKHHWAGLRPGSPNDTPYIGAHPHIKGLYVNAGHYRNGIVMAPASARLMADLILGRPPTFDPTPYQLPVST